MNTNLKIKKIFIKKKSKSQKINSDFIYISFTNPIYTIVLFYLIDI